MAMWLYQMDQLQWPPNSYRMHPWWDAEAKALADKVRGKVKQGTLWPVSEDLSVAISVGITTWLGGAS